MAEQTSPKKTTITGKGLSAKWHGIPVPILLVGAGVGLYFAYRWYQSRNTSSTSAVSSTAPPSSSSPSSGSGYSGTGASGGGGAPGSGGYVPPWAPITPSGAAVDPFLRPTTGQKTVPGPGASYPGPPPSTTPAPSTPAPTPAGISAPTPATQVPFTYPNSSAPVTVGPAPTYTSRGIVQQAPTSVNAATSGGAGSQPGYYPVSSWQSAVDMLKNGTTLYTSSGQKVTRQNRNTFAPGTLLLTKQG